MLILYININEWFNANLLSLSLDKTLFMQFIIKNGSLTDLNVGYNIPISNTSNLKLLGLVIDNAPPGKLM
jgi:hypothetical protein